jgi:hypothetical protein
VIVKGLFSFWVVEMFFSCTLCNITIIICYLLGFRSSLDRASSLLGMMRQKVLGSYRIQVLGELYFVLVR